MKLSRRTALALLGGATIAPSSLVAKKTDPRIQFGAQTNAWPINAATLDSFLDVLQQIRKTGYTGFETGYFNLAQHRSEPEALRAAIKATGLTFFGLHIAVGADKCDPETLLPLPSLYEPWARTAKVLGAQHWIISSIASKSAGDAEKKAIGLRRAAIYAQQVDLPLLYHNHWWEFANDGAEMNTLFDATVDSPVKFLLDAGHAFHAGADIQAVLRRRLDRIAALHLRDYRDGKQVPLGAGTFPLQEAARLLRDREWSGWVLNEEDSDGKQKLGATVIDPAYHALEAAFR
jgi:inosose dehydratase